jgi:peptide/nickel transport system permease protein
MLSYTFKRIGLLFLTLWGISLISFFMIQLAPGSPLDMKLMNDPSGSLSDQSGITEEAREQLAKLYHLDKPIVTRYFLWLGDIAQLEFGESFTDHRPVIEKIKERVPVSLIFGITSIVVALFIGIPLGLLAARFRNTWIDGSISILGIAMYSMPSYVLGILLITFLGGGDFLNLFPIFGIQSDDFEKLSFLDQVLDRTHHFILPCLCYSIGGLAFITQQQRASLIDALSQDYIRTARAKGLSEWLVYMKHAFRNSLIPIATIVGGMVPGILGGAVIVERLFTIPGLGLLAYESILQRDYPMIMATFMMTSFLSLLGYFLSDIIYVLIDPRINFESSEGQE